MKKKLITTIVIAIAILSCNQESSKDNNNPCDYDYGTINPNTPKQTNEFGQFVGLWDCVSKDLIKDKNDDEQWYTNKAFWKWEYILGGHAVLNNWWQEDNSPNPITKEYFASGVFIFNPKTALWEIVVMNSRPHKLSSKFQARKIENNIRINDETKTWQITFYDIKEYSFEWKYEVLTEKGDWKSISEISAKRQL